jgi:hypothetical protein
MELQNGGYYRQVVVSSALTVLFWRLNICAKAVHKMLVKLAQGIPSSSN